MSKLMIENKTDMEMCEAMKYAMAVVARGRVSGKGEKLQYCYCSAFKDGVKVSAFKNKSSDRLVIWE